MKPPNKTKSEITKAYIYNGAIQLFSEKGFENTTIRDLTRELDISLGILYYHFKSKENILIHYFRTLHQKTIEGTAEILSSNKSSGIKIKAVIDINMGLLQENAKVSRDLINTTSNPSHPLSPFGSELKPYKEGAIQLFRNALSSHQVKEKYLDSLAFLFWFYYLGLCLCWANDSSKDDQYTQKLYLITFPLTKKLITLTKVGMGRKLVINISDLLQSILLKY